MFAKSSEWMLREERGGERREDGGGALGGVETRYRGANNHIFKHTTCSLRTSARQELGTRKLAILCLLEEAGLTSCTSPEGLGLGSASVWRPGGSGGAL